MATAPGAPDGQEAAKRQVRGSTLLMAGRGLSVGLNFLTQILTVRYLAKGDYGAFAYALAMASFFAQLSRLGMDKAVSRFAAIQDEQQDYARMFGTLVFAGGLVLVCGSSVAAGVVVLGDSLGHAVVSDPLSLNLLLILIALAPIDGLDYVLQSVFATFSRPRLIVFRKYVVGPLFKLLAILGVMLAASDVRTLAIARLAASGLGLVIAASLVGKVFRERDLLAHFRLKAIQVRAREILGYSVPMLGSDAVLLLRGILVVFFLEYVHGSVSVADFRSVLPVARLNNVAVEAFALLFVPAVARLTAARTPGPLNDMYWRSATWVTVLSLPTFLVTFAFAGPLTVTMFGERYADAAPVLALLSVGLFVHASLSMSGLVLKAAGRIKNVLAVDSSVLAVELLLIVVLIPRHGAVGGAAAFAATAAAHALIYQLVLVRKMDVRLLPIGFGRVYATMALLAAAVLLFAALFSPPLWLGVLVAGGLWALLVVRLSDQLDVAHTFPELLRVPVLGSLLRGADDGDGSAGSAECRGSEIADRLRWSSPPLLPALGDPPHRVRLVRQHVRANSTILELDVEGGVGSLSILVKMGEGEASVGHGMEDFPRIGEPADPASIIEAEKKTLRAIATGFAELDDPRFEPVRVFDFVSDPGTVVMERLSYPTLRQLVYRACLIPWVGPAENEDLRIASANAGAWLRAFQSLPRLDHTRARHADRSALIETMGDFADYLAGSGVDPSLIGEIRERTVSAVRAVLTEDPPCALGHGDYAARNVLVAPSCRVAVIDTPGRWWFPIYLDVGYFLADLRTSLPSTLTGGLLPTDPWLSEIEDSFLGGYFGDEPVARAQIRLYEVLALLAKWASAVHTSRNGAGPVGLTDRMLSRARGIRIRRRLECTLDSIDGAGGLGWPTARVGALGKRGRHSMR